MGVDVGTQSAKVIITDFKGNVVCEGHQRLHQIDIPGPQLAEHPGDDLWDALKKAFEKAITAFNSDPGRCVHDILSMGICIIRCCRVLLKADGSLAYPVISWMDKRLNTPYEPKSAYGDVRYVTTTSGYISHRLTGEFKDTCANYIGWWPMDDQTLDWSGDKGLFKECNVSRDILFDVVRPGEILGYVTDEVAGQIGLWEGIIKEAQTQGRTIEELFNREAESVPAGCEGLLTVHDWAPPVTAVYRKGVMFGFDSRHTRAHIYRSILEGIAFTVKNHMDKMNTALNTPLKHLIISGGGANSNVFMQIFADVFGVPTSRKKMKGSAAIGCVINAGMAVGAFNSYEEAIEKMVHKDDEFMPNAENYSLYNLLNEKVYRRVNTYFDPLLRELNPIVD